MNSPRMHVTYLALGSNLGRRRRNILRAIRLIRRHVGPVAAISELIFSEPWGYQSEHGYVNAVARVGTMLSPQQLLSVTQEIERSMGRTEKSVGGVYHDRIIDIDILLYDDITVDTPELKIPHPLMMQRDFVTIPLRQVLENEKINVLFGC